MPKNIIPVENKVCDKSLGIHIANGKIHDTNGKIDKKSTIWRPITNPRNDTCNDTV